MFSGHLTGSPSRPQNYSRFSSTRENKKVPLRLSTNSRINGTVRITLPISQEAGLPVQPQKSRSERSTKLLVGIVVVFLVRINVPFFEA